MLIELNKWTRKQFEDLPYRENWAKDVPCRSIVLLPLRRLHDSGYRVMDFIACTEEGPVCRLSGCSDVIHLGGIGGEHGGPWAVDCLAKSGLLRFFCRDHHLIAGAALSSFELNAEAKCS